MPFLQWQSSYDTMPELSVLKPRLAVWPLTATCQSSIGIRSVAFLHQSAGNPGSGLKTNDRLPLTLTMLRLYSLKVQECKTFWKPSIPCHFGIHWTALIEYSYISTHVPGFQSFLRPLHYFVLTKLATTSIRVKALAPAQLVETPLLTTLLM